MAQNARLRLLYAGLIPFSAALVGKQQSGTLCDDLALCLIGLCHAAPTVRRSGFPPSRFPVWPQREDCVAMTAAEIAGLPG